MTRRRLLALVTAGLVVLPLLANGTARAASAPVVEKIPLSFTVTVAPEGVLGTTTCTVVADLYKPATANSSTRVPAILTTNGFGGHKEDQSLIAAGFFPCVYA